MSRRVLAVIGCMVIGTLIGGVGHATGRATTVRTCEETSPGYMECDDGSNCFLIDGVWVCHDDAPKAN